MKPISEQTILITGSTDGLGRATARELAALGATVLIHGRNRERLEQSRAEIIDVTGNRNIKGYLADLSELAQVRRLAEDVGAKNQRLDMLINNAGIGAGNVKKPRRELSADGVELRFAVNYLAPFLLTRLLLPRLKASAPARIINVSSVGQFPIDFDDVMLETHYDPVNAYRQSKLAQIMFTIDLAAELEGTGITVNALHPSSLMDTKMVFEWFGHALSTVGDGVEALMNMATSPEFDTISGAYYDRKEQARANLQAYDRVARAQLRKLSEELVGID
ncbi:MAG TPA: SDR family NAD(P)-dependent oxidoreductase [Desulfuromonadales bacterium]|nr:SDR family NAD(P)-dependent oxidoreductase [Desulfuromonadales bacterium]